MSKSTPLESIYKQLGAEFKEYCGWNMPVSFGDIDQEIAGLEQSCAAFDLSCFGRLTVKGSDAGKLVDSLIASDTSSLADGKCVAGFCCDSRGELVDVVRAARQGNSYLLLTTPAGKDGVLEAIAQCKETFGLSDVDVSDQTEKTAMIAVYGPGSFEALNNIIPLDLNEIEENSVKGYSIFMMSITVIRSSWLGGEGMELICPAGAAKFAGGAIEKYHKQENIIPAGMEALLGKMGQAWPGAKVCEKNQGVQVVAVDEFKEQLDMSKEFLGKSALV